MALENPSPDTSSRRFEMFFAYLQQASLTAREGYTLQEALQSEHSVLVQLAQRNEEIRQLIDQLFGGVALWDDALRGRFNAQAIETMVAFGLTNPQQLEALIEAITKEVHTLEMASLLRSSDEYVEPFLQELGKMKGDVNWKAVFKHLLHKKIQPVLAELSPEPLRNELPRMRQIRAIAKAKAHMNKLSELEDKGGWSDEELKWAFYFLLAMEEGLEERACGDALRSLLNDNIVFRLPPIDWQKVEENAPRYDLEGDEPGAQDPDFWKPDDYNLHGWKDDEEGDAA